MQLLDPATYCYKESITAEPFSALEFKRFYWHPCFCNLEVLVLIVSTEGEAKAMIADDLFKGEHINVKKEKWEIDEQVVDCQLFRICHISLLIFINSKHLTYTSAPPDLIQHHSLLPDYQPKHSEAL